MNEEYQTIKRNWSSVLLKQNCIEIYEYLYNIILNAEYPLDEEFVLELLEMAKESDMPYESGPYGNLKGDIEHYIEIYRKKVKSIGKSQADINK
jgi:hypothetical protein